MADDLSRFRFQLCAADQDQYERGDEWFTFDIEDIDATMPTAEVVALEVKLQFTLDQLTTGLAYGSTNCKLIAFWIARIRAGCDDKLEFFTPKVRAASVLYLDDRPEPGDAAPPAAAASDAEPPSS